MLKFLIADNDSFARETLEKHLKRQFPVRSQCRTAENGRIALDLAVLWGADILLMDIEMQGMNGLEAARQILSQCPGCQIIFVTGSRRFEYAYEALKIGACDYILKPVNAGELESAVSRAIDRMEALRRLKTVAPVPEIREEELLQDKQTLLMAKAKKYLQHNYMIRNISLDAVSAILNLNASYFSAQFKRSFGVSFVDYLTELRIQAAKQLLEDPLRHAAEVAHMVGYESANYFTRTFKKKTGMTPTEYRRSVAKNRAKDSC